MNEEREPRKDIYPGFGLAQTAVMLESRASKSSEPGPKRDSLGTRIADAVTGTNRAKPVVLAILRNAHEAGEIELTDREILRRFDESPRKFRDTNIGAGRALKKLAKEGQVHVEHFTAEQAVNQPGSRPGDNYSTPYFPEPETIYEVPSEQPQDPNL